MIELTQHIERLLLENDCVIIPDFGGFVAYNNHSQRVENEYLFLPPTRTIGFNPQLKLNDGLLIQSYMTVHDTNFADASRMVDNEVEQLIAALHERGQVALPNIGELHYTLEQTYEFTPFNEKLTSPWLYGLDSFEMKDLATIRREKTTLQPATAKTGKKTYDIRINRAFVRNAVAAVAAIALFFALSTPVENTYVAKGSYAQLLPVDIFETIESQSVITTPVKAQQTQKKEATTSKPITVKEIKVAPETKEVTPVIAAATSAELSAATTPATPPAKATAIASSTDSDVAPQFPTTTGKFHLIVASSIAQDKADNLVAKLKALGYNCAKVLNASGKLRVSIMSLPSREEAGTELAKLRTNETFHDAWMLVY